MTVPSAPRAARVALVLWNGDVGGAEVLTAALAARMRLQGAHAVVVFVGEPEPLAARLRESAVPYRSLGFSRGRDVLRHPRRYATEVARAGPDGVVLVECGFMGAALRLGGYRAAIVAAEHGAILEAPSDRLARRMSWWLARSAGAWADDAEVAVSEFILRRVRCHPHASKPRLIYNGIDPARFAADDHDTRTGRDGCIAGFAGRLIHGKGADYLIRALSRVQTTHQLTAVIAGEGPERRRLESIARDLGVQDSVRFLGLVHDMPAFWRSTDVAVVPSAQFTEACPMTPLEAMAAGRPVLATHNGGIPELVSDGETGLLVATGDVDALAGALRRYAESPDLAASHGTAGRRRLLEHFDIDGCARAYLDLFSELAASR